MPALCSKSLLHNQDEPLLERRSWRIFHISRPHSKRAVVLSYIPCLQRYLSILPSSFFFSDFSLKGFEGIIVSFSSSRHFEESHEKQTPSDSTCDYDRMKLPGSGYFSRWRLLQCAHCIMGYGTHRPRLLFSFVFVKFNSV